jgi:hypothetical protein
LSTYPAMSAGWSTPVGRLLSRSALGILTPFVSPDLVDEVLVDTDRGEQRWRALPALLGVYFVLALCLQRTKSCSSVLRSMIPWDRLARLAELGWQVPCSKALTKLRDRLGPVPLEVLFDRLTGWRPTRRTGWSHAFGLEVCAWDATEIEMADTPANQRFFGRHRRLGRATGVPKARLLVLLACGSRKIIGAVAAPLAAGEGEPTLAKRLVAALRPGMLLLADRAFLGYPLWTSARARGAHLLWRAKQSKPLLPVKKRLSDGSWLSVLYDPADARAWRRNVSRNRKRGHKPPKPRPIKGEIVRVVEALITVTTEHGTRTERYRLVTSLLDPRTAPAEQLVALYARRWVVETGIREIKTVLLAGRALRGHTPARAMQELWATLCVYQAIRLLICRAALTQDLDPSRISFTAARDTAQHALITTPAQAHRCLDPAGQDLCEQLITHHTSHRIFPRALKNTLPRYPWRGRTRQLTSTNASYQVRITPPANPNNTTSTPAQPRAA